MIEMTFSPDMRCILAGMKGKIFKSYECDLSQRWRRTSGAFRINLGRYAVDVTCVNRPVVDWDIEEDDPTVFACTEQSLSDPFFPEGPSGAQVYMVNEVITNVGLVNDTISFNGEPAASVDVALVLWTKFKTYTFARGIWFDYTIDVSVSDDVVVPYSTEECEDDWSDEEDGDARVARRLVVL